MEHIIDHSEVENEVGKDIGQTMCNSVENAEHRAPRIHNPKNSITTGSDKDPAVEERFARNLYSKVVRAEQLLLTPTLTSV